MGRKRKASPATKTVWSTDNGQALVGKGISVYWQPENTYYNAMVLAYHADEQRHKLLYLEDESIEVVELGRGVAQRDYTPLDKPKDKLVGKDVIFLDKEHGDDEWFHFMRDSDQGMGDPFVVKVVEALASANDEDVSGPRDPDGRHKYYRIVYLPSEYLATIDFAQVDYMIDGQQPNLNAGDEKKIKISDPDDDAQVEEEEDRREDEPEAEVADAEIESPVKEKARKKEDSEKDIDDLFIPETQPPAEEKHSPQPEPEPELDLDAEADTRRGAKPKSVSNSRDPTPDLFHDLDDTPPRKKSKKQKVEESDEAYDTKMDVDMGDDDSDAPLRTGKHSVDVDPSPEVDEFDIDIDKVAKVVSADDVLRAQKDDLDLMGDPGLDTAMRSVGEGSLGTQDTRDDPLGNVSTGGEKKRRVTGPRRADLLPPTFDDEEGNDTASDEQKLGWVSSGKKEKAQVGDYIMLKTGGGVPRKAFVEAYLPETSTHFVAFCDTRGGNVQIELKKDNFALLDDEEVEKITRTQEREVSSGEEHVVAKKAKRRARSPKREEKKSKRHSRASDIKGQAADASICGRCISIVWPVENLVYVALVLGYSSHSKEHQIVYMVDHCVETLDLRFREWTLLPREKEPWISTGMVGKRVYVFWEGSYDDEGSQKIANEKFGESTRVPYEAYVLSYIGNGKYKIIYTATEDTETRELKVEEEQSVAAIDKEWDLLDENVKNVDGLPLIGWTD